MNILYVYDGDWPKGATRVAKETRALSAAGHAVHLLSRNDLGERREEVNEWMTITRLPYTRIRFLNRVMNFPYFFNPVWLHAIWSAARKRRSDCILVCDLPLAPTAVWVGERLGIPVCYDMAEVYPEFLRGLWDYDDMGWTDHIVRNPKAAEVLEKYVLRKVTKVFVVSEESAARCIRLGVSRDNVIVVGNTPENVDELMGSQERPGELDKLEGRPIILFVGILIGDRGVARAVEAMTSVVKEAPEAVLVIVGDGPERPLLEQRVLQLDLTDNVVIMGWRNHNCLPQYYSSALIGLLPFLDGSHVRLTLANKQFDYMASGLPIVASDLPPIRRIVDETQSGLLVPPNDPAGMAGAILTLLQNEPMRKALGKNGQRAVLLEYNWQQDRHRLISAIGGLNCNGEAAGALRA